MNAITYHQCANCMTKTIFRMDDFDEETTECPECHVINWRDDEDMLAEEEDVMFW